MPRQGPAYGPAGKAARVRTSVARDQSVDAHLVHSGRPLSKLCLRSERERGMGWQVGQRWDASEAAHRMLAWARHHTLSLPLLALGRPMHAAAAHLRRADDAVHGGAADRGEAGVSGQHALAWGDGAARWGWGAGPSVRGQAGRQATAGASSECVSSQAQKGVDHHHRCRRGKQDAGGRTS